MSKPLAGGLSEFRLGKARTLWFDSRAGRMNALAIGGRDAS